MAANPVRSAQPAGGIEVLSAGLLILLLLAGLLSWV